MIELNDGQEAIVKKAINWFYNSSEQVFQYSGAAGTGKSVVMNAIIERLGLEPYEVAPMSYIGAASVVMRIKGLSNAKTIHSWLYEPKWVIDGYDKYLNKPKRKMAFVPKPLPDTVRLICIDEAGCVPLRMKYEIESRGIKVLACGDLNQLPPVEDNPAYLYSGKVEQLTEIMRQAKNSPIIYLAHRILAGERIDPCWYSNVWVLTLKDLERYPTIIENSEVVICGKNSTREYYNHVIREDYKHIYSKFPVYGDRMVCRKNNWQVNTGGLNLANGLVGTVVSAPDISTYTGKTFTMDFQPDISNIPFTGLECDYEYLTSGVEKRKLLKASKYSVGEKFEYAYAITAHISQGSQYGLGTYISEYLNSAINKNLDYTGITRFSKGCYFVLAK